MTETFVSALVGAPFGLKGWVKIRSLSGETEHLLSLRSISLRRGEDTREYTVEAASASPPTFKLAGIDSPEAAKTLKGAEILVPRDQAAPLEEGEFYIEDLRGLEVFCAGKAGKAETVGAISEVIEGGGAFLAEISLPSGEKKLVPFRNEFFGPVDPASGRVELFESWILE
jgi:16S rRNA processing protein RimM